MLPAQSLVTPAKKSVATAGTPVQLTTTLPPVDQVVLIGNPNNTGTVYIGDSNVLAATPRGIPLSPGQAISFEGSRRRDGSEGIDLSSIWIDAVNSGDSVLWGYLQR